MVIDMHDKTNETHHDDHKLQDQAKRSSYVIWALMVLMREGGQSSAAKHTNKCVLLFIIRRKKYEQETNGHEISSPRHKREGNAREDNR